MTRWKCWFWITRWTNELIDLFGHKHIRIMAWNRGPSSMTEGWGDKEHFASCQLGVILVGWIWRWWKDILWCTHTHQSQAWDFMPIWLSFDAILSNKAWLNSSFTRSPIFLGIDESVFKHVFKVRFYMNYVRLGYTLTLMACLSSKVSARTLELQPWKNLSLCTKFQLNTMANRFIL